MRPPGELDHYELLEIPRGASAQDVERAWRLMRQAYDEDSLGAYSVLDTSELAALRERIDAAYRVLSDPELRRAYDAEAPRTDAGEPAGAPGHAGPAAVPEVSQPDPGQPAAAPPRPAPGSAVASARPALEMPSFEDFEASEEDPDAEWDGPRLRRARLRRGVEIEQVAGVTKVNPTYLRFIEEENFDALPAAVYVRGFVVAMARLLGIDAQRVAHSYMKRFDASRSRSETRRRSQDRP